MLSRELLDLDSCACFEKQDFSWVLHLTPLGFLFVFSLQKLPEWIDLFFWDLSEFLQEQAASCTAHSDGDQGIKFSILPHFCWVPFLVFKDILSFQLGSEHVGG